MGKIAEIWTIEKLNKFSEEIGKLFQEGKIKCPIHLHGGRQQAEKLISMFDNHYEEEDWILGTWRSQWLWLLSGKSVDDLKKQIMDGHSMHIYGYKFFTSAIVGGIAPIAVGIAKALKLKNSNSIVWCFLGDMGASTGISMESIKYACGHHLPVKFIIEDNGLSVNADTKETWGCNNCFKENCNIYTDCNVITYKHKRFYPHAGTGKYVMF